jgi:hypothetical protein
MTQRVSCTVYQRYPARRSPRQLTLKIEPHQIGFPYEQYLGGIHVAIECVWPHQLQQTLATRQV